MAMLFDPAQGDTPVKSCSGADVRGGDRGGLKIIGVDFEHRYAQMPVAKLPQRIHPWTRRPFSSSIDYIAFRINSATFGTPGTQFTYASKIGLFTFGSKGFRDRNSRPRHPAFGRIGR